MDVKARNCLIMSKTNQKKEKISLKKKAFYRIFNQKMTITNKHPKIQKLLSKIQIKSRATRPSMKIEIGSSA